MDHPLRTLLYELFVKPFLTLVQQAFGQKANARPPKSDTSGPTLRTTKHPTAGATCFRAPRNDTR